MLYSRRQIVMGATATIVLPTAGLAKRPMFIDTKGTKPAPLEDQKRAADIISHLPKDTYVNVMAALAALERTETPGSRGEPWNRRWHQYANPLLVRIWRDMGYSESTDCTAWCGVTLGWCLKRSGWIPPLNCASSQSYLTYGTPVTNPQPGDLCIFTDFGDKSHGHVTIFVKALPTQKSVRVLGANQSLSEPTNCPGNLDVNVIDERTMALQTKGHYLHKYIRVPVHAGHST